MFSAHSVIDHGATAVIGHRDIGGDTVRGYVLDCKSVPYPLTIDNSLFNKKISVISAANNVKVDPIIFLARDITDLATRVVEIMLVKQGENARPIIAEIKFEER